jgi:hypothetical protein
MVSAGLACGSKVCDEERKALARGRRTRAFAAVPTVAIVFLCLMASSAVAVPAKFYGLQFPYADSPKNMKIVGHSGADYFRVNFDPSMSHESIEKIFDLAYQNGVTILPDVYSGEFPAPNACVVGGNKWRELVQYLAKDYGPGGKFWEGRSNPKPVEAIEIWNEPNRGRNGPDTVKSNPSETAYFVNKCADAIHEVAGSTKVIMGGLLNIGSTGWVEEEENGKKVKRYNYTVHDFLEVVHNLEPTAHYDGVGLHPYVFKPSGKEEVFERIGKNITAGREAVDNFISSKKSIWITEVGWPSWGEDSAHATTAEPERSYVLGETFTWIENHQSSYDIQSLIYFNYRDFGNGAAWDERCGLLRTVPSDTGIDEAGNVLSKPYSGSVFTNSWYTYQTHAGATSFPTTPGAGSNGATFVTATEARLLGSYSGYEIQSEYQFEWGPKASYGNLTPRHDAGFDNSNHDVILPGEERWGQLITGLSPGTTYHYRMVVRNENGTTSYGKDDTFTTKELPGATTKAASSVNQLDAVLNGSVNPKGENTSYYFEYGPTTSYGSSTASTSAGWGEEATEVQQEIAGLEYGVTYHFRIAATSWVGTANGEDKTFTPTYKGPAPAVSTKAATTVADTSATLNGYVSPNGAETKVYFEYGPTAEYGLKTAEVGVGSGTTTLEKSLAVTKLEPNVKYHFRIVATNGSGTTKGADRTFVPGWSIQSTPSPKGAYAAHEGVSCLSPTDCYAVGYGAGQAIAQHWNGTEWSEQKVTPPTGSLESVLLGVSCSSSSACTAVGRYKNASSKWVVWAVRLKGTEWEQNSAVDPATTGAELEDVSCSSDTECIAVGDTWSTGPPEVTKTLIERWSSSKWSVQTSKNPSETNNHLTSVSCVPTTSCVAAGFYSDKGTMTPLSETWSGGSWSQPAVVKPSGATISWFFGVSCVTSKECTAVGKKEISAYTHEYETVVERWNGSNWEEVKETPNPATGSFDLEDVSCTASNACTAVGSYGDNLSVTHPFALHWNGSAWELQTPPMPAGNKRAQPRDVSCVVSRGCEAVGFQQTAASEFLTFAEGYFRGPPPTVTTQAATGVGEKVATLNGTVNANGSASSYYFEYGTSKSYGSKTTEASAGSGSSPVEKSQSISGLSANTEYHYRIVALNENPDPAYGVDQTFTTTGPPSVGTGSGVPDATTGKDATLNGFVDPNGQSTTYQFEYGTTPGSYKTTVPIPAESAGSEMNGKWVSYKITALTRGTTYYFRITATNPAGKVNGSENSFTTPDAPTVETLSATEVKQSKAHMEGLVSAHGETTQYWFEYGTTTSYGASVPLKPISLEEELAPVNQEVTGLEEETLYHYRVVAENQLGTDFGEDRTFTTTPPATVALCTVDESPCEPANIVTHVHETTLSGAKATLLNSISNLLCDVLFLGDVLEEVIEGLALIHGNFTYTNCADEKPNACTVTEENGPATIEVLMEGYETAKVTGEGLVKVACSGISCRYVGTGLVGHALGPLLSSETNGSVSISEQSITKEGGLLCPATAKLDITVTPLTKAYLS